MKSEFTINPNRIIEEGHKPIYCFPIEGDNIDDGIVKSFGEEWKKFHHFTDEEIQKSAAMYFDILESIELPENAYAIDIGCGMGRWSKYLSGRLGFIEMLDPSEAIFSADILLKDVPNVRLIQSSAESIPFEDDTFDFAYSIGVLHHLPDTRKAVKSCVKKVKLGGFFYLYLYYNLDNRGILFRTLFLPVNALRRLVSIFPGPLKQITCDFIAISVYWPFSRLSWLLRKLGFSGLGSSVPLGSYYNKSFTVLRANALDRFGTTIEHRFSRQEVIAMMKESGLDEIIVSDNEPFYHAIGRRCK